MRKIGKPPAKSAAEPRYIEKFSFAEFF